MKFIIIAVLLILSPVASFAKHDAETEHLFKLMEATEPRWKALQEKEDKRIEEERLKAFYEAHPEARPRPSPKPKVAEKSLEELKQGLKEIDEIIAEPSEEFDKIVITSDDLSEQNENAEEIEKIICLSSRLCRGP